MPTKNPNLPALLRAIASGTHAKQMRHDIIFLQAARELEDHGRYETTPHGDVFLRSFIIDWMLDNGLEVPVAATPTELLEFIRKDGK